MVHLRKRDKLTKTKSFSELRHEASRLSVPKKSRSKRPVSKSSAKAKTSASRPKAVQPAKKDNASRRKAGPVKSRTPSRAATPRSSSRGAPSNELFSKILSELRTLKGNLRPTKKTVKVASGPVGKTSLSEAVKHICSKENKFAIIDWIQRTVDKKTSDEVSQQIGLIEAKQARKKQKTAEKTDKPEAAHEGEAGSKKLKTDKPEETGNKSPIKKSPIKGGHS